MTKDNVSSSNAPSSAFLEVSKPAREMRAQFSPDGLRIVTVSHDKTVCF